MIIATKEAPPFSYKLGNRWTGISIALLHRIAKVEGFTFTLKEMSLDDMLEATQRNEVNAAAAALTITAIREQAVDFTHPFHSSGLGIMVRSDRNRVWLDVLGRLTSLEFLEAVGALVLLLTLIGASIWLVERGRNPHFPRSIAGGVGSGLWWSAVTMTTVGYGDKAPITLIGRLIGLLWMFTSIIIISSFTAAITTSLTVGTLRNSIQTLSDLRGKSVVTLARSTTASYLDGERIPYATVDSVTTALTLLGEGEIDAIVYDAPILQHLMKQPAALGCELLPVRFARQDYGLALPDGSLHREAWNRTILSLIESPEWQSVLDSYLGVQHN